ncbi:hypothetical protein D9M71_641120 [compost metagenome]
MGQAGPHTWAEMRPDAGAHARPEEQRQPGTDHADQQGSLMTGQADAEQQLDVGGAEPAQTVAGQAQRQGEQRGQHRCRDASAQPAFPLHDQVEQGGGAAAKGQPVGDTAVAGVLPGTDGQPGQEDSGMERMGHGGGPKSFAGAGVSPLGEELSAVVCSCRASGMRS